MEHLAMFAEASAVSEVLDSVNLIPVLAIGLGSLIAVVAIVFSALAGLAAVRSREATRREIAAYVAEGSLTPEQGAALMEAGKPKD